MRLGIDLGGTTISLGLVSGSTIVDSITGPSFPLNASLEQTLEHLYSTIDRIIRPDVASIGIGVPSVVDTVKGIVYDTANIPSWKEVHLKEELENIYNIPVRVNNDANCFALGAAGTYGCSGEDILAGITLGTGVGIGIVTGGILMNGANTGAGELSWLPYKNGKSLEHACCKAFFLEKGRTPLEFANLASEGDTEALAVFKEFGENLAWLAVLVMSAYDPGRIVFGGGISSASKYFDASMRGTLREIFPFPKSVENLKIEYLPENHIAITGASML